jgi:hypothetical protein
MDESRSAPDRPDPAPYADTSFTFGILWLLLLTALTPVCIVQYLQFGPGSWNTELVVSMVCGSVLINGPALLTGILAVGASRSAGCRASDRRSAWGGLLVSVAGLVATVAYVLVLLL